MQWDWNLGLAHALAMTHYIPCHQFLNNQTAAATLDTLIDLHSQNDEVVLKRMAIEKWVSRLQYRIPETADDLKGISPPEDAVDVIVDRLLNEISSITDTVEHPKDRGDYSGSDVFPFYPRGRGNFRLSFES